MEIGVYNDIDIDVYHSDKTCISASQFKECIKSMKHFEAYGKKESERKSHFDFGNALELLLIDAINGTSNAESDVFVLDESTRPQPEKNYTNAENKKWKEEQYSLAGNRYIISKTGEESLEVANAIIANVKENKLILKLLANTDYQKTIVWEDKATGLRLKTRPDTSSINKKVLVDIKTTRDASPKSFEADIKKMNYPIQAIFQMRGCIESGIFDEVNNYYWLACEKVSPYNVQLYRLPSEHWDILNKIMDYYLMQIKMGYENNYFEGYSLKADNEFGVIDVKLPEYYLDKL